ncbi:MAG TPA: T9SS type A sorting domain-containing protein, partial [Bacteroidia bacterium]
SDEKSPEVDFLYNGTYNVYLIFKKDKYRQCVDSAIKLVEIKGCYVNSSYYIGRDTTTTYSGFIYNTSYTARPSKTSLMWYFGDGDSSSLWTPTHTYPGAGSYNLCLVVRDSICTSTYCDSIGFDGSGQMLAMPFSIKIIDQSNLTSLESIKDGVSKFIIYPNPSKGLYQLQSEINGTYTITNAYGNTVLTGSASDQTSLLDLTAFADGIYFVQFTDATGQSNQLKLIKCN